MGARDASALLPALKLAGAASNALDRAIEYVAPRYAVKRMAARGMLALSGGGYNGARIDKASLSRYLPTAGSANADTIRDLPMLRARSRDQMRNAPLALGAMETTITHVVGTGLSLQPAIPAAFLGLTDEEAAAWQEDARFRFNTWSASTDCDLSRRLNFYGLQELAFRSTLESGDTFILTPRIARAGAAARLALQVLEADRICNPDRKPNTKTLVEGIELDEATGEEVAVHIASRHPGDATGGTITWESRKVRGDSTGRRNVLHLFKQLRPEQVRGVPWIAPVLEPLKQLGRYTDAELNAAVVSAVFAVFIKMDPEAFQDLFDDDAKNDIAERAAGWSGEMESGKAVNLLPGESVETSAPGRPNTAFDPFVQAILRQIGVALQLPYEVLVMHFQSSYTAARGALLMAWKFFRARRDWLATVLCQPVYELWLADEVAEGRMAAPGFFADPVVRAAWCGATWIGDGPGSVDPLKEVQAAKERVALGISTLQAESILHDGVGWEEKHRQRVKESRARRDDGMDATAAAPASPAAPTPPDPKEEEDDDDDEDRRAE